MNRIVILGILVIVFLGGCGVEKKLIGDINMISERNIDSRTNYIELKRYAGASKREMRNAKSKNLQDAVDVLVKSVPGGEFIKNAKIFLVNNMYYAIQGDVWGVEASFAGFKKGDRVQKRNRLGTIQSLINDEYCMVLFDGEKIAVKVRYSKIVKI